MPAHAVVDKYSIMMEDDKVVVGASSMQGWRSTMEDAHTVYLTLPRLKDAHEEDGAVFAVFDGHCGSRAAHLCSTNIVHWLCLSDAYNRGDYAKGLTEAFIKGDEALRHQLEKEHNESGCAAVVALIVGRTLYCASSGDARAVLCSKGIAQALTEDHKPSVPAELKRIEHAGSFVAQGRVGGMLALSRAFGDFRLKDASLPPHLAAVTVVPDVVVRELNKDDEFLIVACDGLFEKKTSEELVALVRSQLSVQDDMSMVCEQTMMECLGGGPQVKGSDNMTIIIVRFKDALAGNGYRVLSANNANVSGSSPPANGATSDEMET